MAGAFSMRIGRTLAVVGLLIGAALGLVAATMGLLYATTTKPRVTEGWLLGPSLPAARGELATAIAYGEQCVDLPCPQAERLYVLGGLSRFFRPLRSVTVFDPNRKLWTVGPSLPAPRHHLAAATIGQMIYVSGGTAVAGWHLGMAWPPMDNFWRLAARSDRWESAWSNDRAALGPPHDSPRRTAVCRGWSWALRSCVDLYARSRLEPWG